VRHSLLRGLVRTWIASAGGSCMAVPFFEWTELVEVACGGFAAAAAGSAGVIVTGISARSNPLILASIHGLTARFGAAVVLLIAIMLIELVKFGPFALTFGAAYMAVLAVETVTMARLRNGNGRPEPKEEA